MANIVPVELIATKILIIRGKKVMLDRDIAHLYGVQTKRLNEQVSRNKARFPEDFMFQLTKEELDSLRSHFATLNSEGRDLSKRGRHPKYLPYAFTEQGVAMLSSVLNSERAIKVNILIMRAFVKLRDILSRNKELSVKLKELEERIEGHDADIRDIFEAIRQLMRLPDERQRITGFAAK